MSRFTRQRSITALAVDLSRARAETYLSLGVLGIDHDPSDLNDLRAVLGDIDAVLVTRRGNVDDAVLLELLRCGWLLRLRMAHVSRPGRCS